MIPPPGFSKPIWRGWEEDVGVKAKLVESASVIEKSLGGCHHELVKREETHCPWSSNQHHYVRQVPHSRHEAHQTGPRNRRKQGIWFCKVVIA